MANSTTNITALTQSQASKYATVNGLFDACSQAMFGARVDTSEGLDWDYYGGNIMGAAGNIIAVANGTLTLTNTATNYIEMTQAGVISKNTSGFTAGATKLYTAVTSGGVVTAYTDYRVSNNAASAYITTTASTTNALGALTAEYYGKTLFWSPSGSGTFTLPANGATAGSFIDVILLTDQTITMSAATADTLITVNDLTADSVAFSTAGQKIGSAVRFISNGTYWVAINKSSNTMTVAS